ncbi:MAG: glycosyltransferase [Candidatus Saccharimonadales bacterium]
MGRKLLFISNAGNLRGGSQSSLIGLLKSCKKRGHYPHLIVPEEGDLSGIAETLGIEHTVVRYSRWRSSTIGLEKGADFVTIPRLVELISKLQPDCVVTNTLVVPWGAVAAAIADVPHIWVAREFFVHHRSDLKDYYDFIDSYSNLVIANSKSNADYLRKEAGINNAKHFYSYVDVSGVRLSSDDSIKIIDIGIVHPDKNQLELLKAATALKQKNELGGTRIIFIGEYREDDYWNEIQGLIRKNKLEDNVEFTGFIKDPYGLVGPNDILVQPSKHESLGRTITEAMKLGMICVGADVSGTKEAIRLGGGIVYKSGDSKALANVLSDILINHDKYRIEAQKAKARAHKNLSEKASHQPFFDELDMIFGQKNPRRELRHLSPHFKGLIYLENEVTNLRKKTESQNQLLERQQRELIAIFHSRAWKAAVRARKLKVFPKELASRLQMKKRPVHFVYLKSREFYGSSVMRVNQLSEIAQEAAHKQDIKASPLNSEFKNSILVLTKWALEGLNVEALDKLKNRQNILIFDPVDAYLPAEKAKYADVIVAASRTAFHDYSLQFKGKKVLLVDHHVDPRLKTLDWSRRPVALRAGYFGELVNAFSTPAIQSKVDFIQISTNKQENDWLNLLPKYNLHYAIRQVGQKDNHKPFLKGFTAAHCGSNILIQDSQEEAVHWLGEDYPYLLKGEVTEEKVLDKLKYIEETFGTSIWNKATKRMIEIREKTSEQGIGRQLKSLFNEANSL